MAAYGGELLRISDSASWRAGRLLAIMSLCAAAASAQSNPLPITGELQVNQFTTNDQGGPAAGMSADGRHVIAWTSTLQDGDGFGIIQRKFPADGTTPFNESVLNQSTAGNQIQSAIGMNADGDWVAVWKTTASGAKIRARFSGNNGATLGNEISISQDTTNAEIPAATRSDNDSFVAAWNAPANFRVFDAAGQPVTPDLAPSGSLSSTARPRVATTPQAGFVVALTADDNDNLGIYAQRFDSAGDAVGNLITVPESEVNSQQDVDISAAADGSFVVVWKDVALGIRARCFTAAGTPRSGEIPLVSLVAIPRVAVAPGGAFVVTYVSTDIVALEFDRTCNPVGTPFQVNTTTDGLQAGSVVAAGTDRFVVAWHTENLDGSGLAVARRLYRFRSIFADGFESGDDLAWSASPAH